MPSQLCLRYSESAKIICDAPRLERPTLTYPYTLLMLCGRIIVYFYVIMKV